MREEKKLLELNRLVCELESIDHNSMFKAHPVFSIMNDVLYLDYAYFGAKYYDKIEKNIDYAKNVLFWCSVWIRKETSYFNTMILKYYQYDDFLYKFLEIEI